MRQYIQLSHKGVFLLAILCAPFGSSNETVDVADQSLPSFETALAEYVHRKDPVYRYKLQDTLVGKGFIRNKPRRDGLFTDGARFGAGAQTPMFGPVT